MTVFDVVVNTDDLVVLGPPDVIDLSVSIGQQGDRGATFYAGSGNPNDAVVSSNIFGTTITPVSGDIYINTASGADYGWLYIYNPKVVGNQWDQVLKLQPSFSARQREVTFSSGIATMSVPLSEILPTGVSQNDPDAYVVNLTPIFSEPIALSINSKTISGTNLEVVIEAVSYASSTWSQLDSTINIQTAITVV